MTSRRKPPSTTMIVCISVLLLPPYDALGFVGLLLPLRFFRLLVIADDAFQGADAECRAFLAGGYDGDRTQGHVAPPLVFMQFPAVSRASRPATARDGCGHTAAGSRASRRSARQRARPSAGCRGTRAPWRPCRPCRKR